MFVITLTYVAPLDRVDELLAEHVAWLEGQYASGLFLASGRRVPRTGGVILAAGDEPRVRAALAADPFAVAGVAEYEVVEFLPTKTRPELAFLTEL
ncbi:YciI family protein [Longispora albida]|uniref:YciI family protein n=1 Tax=Longispora albida TaxID=203523 RepID=UPI00036702B7|nr:YciI family protein [Longispora albida]